MKMKKEITANKKVEAVGGGGDFIKPGSQNYDLIINVLVGIKRTLTNLV